MKPIACVLANLPEPICTGGHSDYFRMADFQVSISSWSDRMTAGRPTSEENCIEWFGPHNALKLVEKRAVIAN
jgi:hypothetical protein